MSKITMQELSQELQQQLQALAEGGNAGGVANFSGSGQETVIPHNLGVIPTSAYAFPLVNPEGYLGEVWIRMDSTNLYIGNSGSFTGEMVWTAIK